MLLGINQIIERFRTHGRCVKFSPQTITYMAKKIGYHLQSRGGKVGYDQSLITAITQRFDEVLAYENSLKQKTSQRPLKQPQMGDYYTYNGERDNVDYDWEKNESIKKSDDMILYCNNSKKIHINESSLSLFLNEVNGFQRGEGVFRVKKMLDKPVMVSNAEVTDHWGERGDRRSVVNDVGDCLYSFIVNTGHPNGDEIHTITEKAWIIIQNARTRRLVTILAARPAQIVRYWEKLGLELPNDLGFKLIMRFASNNVGRGINKI